MAAFPAKLHQSIGKMTKKWKSWPCPECGVEEGQLHQLGCDMEVCPICGNQLIGCEHYDQLMEGEITLTCRIPYLPVPNVCALCGEQWPEVFDVPDEEWEKYVIPDLQNKVLCWECFDELKKLFPNGWKFLSGRR